MAIGTFILLMAAAQSEPDSAALRRFEQSRPLMGTQFRIVLHAETEEVAAEAFDRGFARVEDLNMALSDYAADSEASLLGAASGTGPKPVSRDLFDVLVRSAEFSEASSGAFDATVGPVVKLWRRARHQHRLPEEGRVEEFHRLVGFQRMRLDPERRTVDLTIAGMRLDFGGIAKGYAADEALAAMRRVGVDRALIDAGGDVVAGEAPPGTSGWRVGISPLRADSGEPVQRVTLRRRALATSGDLYAGFELDGTRYSHLIDPRTGWPITTPRQVSVLADDGAAGDALASAISVLGPFEGLALAERLGVEARVVQQGAERGVPEVFATDRWPAPEAIRSP